MSGQPGVPSEHRHLPDPPFLLVARGEVPWDAGDPAEAVEIVACIDRGAPPGLFRELVPEAAWLLGVLWLGARWHPVRRLLALSGGPAELRDNTLHLLAADALPPPPRRRGFWLLGDDDALRELVALGLAPRRSAALRFPDLAAELVPSFLRGCFEAAGGVHAGGRPTLTLTAASCGFLDQVASRLAAVGTACQREVLPRVGGHRLRLRPPLAPVFELLYRGAPARAQLATRRRALEAAATVR